MILTLGSKYCVIVIKDFYLESNLDSYKYMKIAVNNILLEFMKAYNLHDLVTDGYVYVEIRGRMYGLPQAGRISHNELV